MKTLKEYEEWFQTDPDSMTGEDMFYYCYLEGCSIWYKDDSGEIVRFINHWRIYYLNLCIHIIHGFHISYTNKEGNSVDFEYETLEEMLDGKNMPDGKTLREVLKTIDKKDLFL